MIRTPSPQQLPWPSSIAASDRGLRSDAGASSPHTPTGPSGSSQHPPEQTPPPPRRRMLVQTPKSELRALVPAAGHAPAHPLVLTPPPPPGEALIVVHDFSELWEGPPQPLPVGLVTAGSTRRANKIHATGT